MRKPRSNDGPRALNSSLVVALFFLAPAFALPRQASAQLRLTQVVVPELQTTQEQAATEMFLQESARRTVAGSPLKLERGRLQELAPHTAALLIVRREAVLQLLPADLVGPFGASLRASSLNNRPEGFAVLTLQWHAATVVVLAGNDVRGELFGAGWLLRQMSFNSGVPLVPAALNTFQSPEKPVRSHQIGYRFKNNTYDAWALPQFEQQIRDLAIFGANTIQLIAPVSDDQPASPLNPAPPLETLLGISAILKKYGLNCDLYYPEMRPDYADPEQVVAELHAFEALVKAMPQLDALYVPGGDPGHTNPELLFSLVASEATILRKYHPNATVWVSAQGFDRTSYEQFYSLLSQRPAWLTGVFFGPQSRDSFFTQRRRVPAQYAMQFYPDIAHTMHSQFPVPQWDPIFALTEGREPICPRPEAFAAIYRRFAALHTGFVTYSEGVNDDVNKMLWSQLGWSASTPVDQILSEYARFFLYREGPQNQLAVDAIHGLERDWDGPIANSTAIPNTRHIFTELEAQASPAQIDRNPQWESLLYRANYDDFLQRKLSRERTAESSALASLTDTAIATAQARVEAATSALASSTPTAEEIREHGNLFILAGELFHDWGLQLSVKLYGASAVERGANLDHVDTPLIERNWLARAMQLALERQTEPERLNALAAIADWRGVSIHAFYDDLGNPAAEPHLVRSQSPATDPEMYLSAIDGIADRTLADGWRLSWLDYAETLYETPLEMRYTNLDPTKHYSVRITYAGEGYALPLQLSANGAEVHPARLRVSNPETIEFPIPSAAIGSSTLELKWTGPAGTGGSGRGRQVAEVWLIPH